jgi:hypothetical protein
LTAFTDGCSGLRSILLDAGVTKPPLLDRLHIAMRLQHAEKTASKVPTDTPERENARAVIITEVERLHWRIRDVLPIFQSEGGRKKDPAWRRLWKALRGIDRYLTKRLAGHLCRAPSRRSAGRHVDPRRDHQLPGQPPHEQIPADALVSPWCRPPPGPLRYGKLGSSFCPLFQAVDPASELAMAA